MRELPTHTHTPLCFLVDHERDGDVRFPEWEDEIARETRRVRERASETGHGRIALTSNLESARPGSARRDFQNLFKGEGEGER